MGIQSNIRDALLPQPPSFKKKKEYTILETLGRGGFGKVVKAHWRGEGEGKDVALKYVPIHSLSMFPFYLHCYEELREDLEEGGLMDENEKKLMGRIIPKKLVKHDLSLVTDEINVLKSLDHPNIVHVWDHFESRDK
jgi:calcium/calmodulin-dependent protein kinase I